MPNTFIAIYSAIIIKRQEKMYLKMLSAANNCLTLPMNEANSVDPEQTAPVCHRDFLNISADEKNRKFLLRLAH